MVGRFISGVPGPGPIDVGLGGVVLIILALMSIPLMVAAPALRLVVSGARRLRARAHLAEAIRARILTFPQDTMGLFHVALVMADGSVVEDVVVTWGDGVVHIAGSEDYSLDPSLVADALDRSYGPA
jgi:hypothetical protein